MKRMLITVFIFTLFVFQPCLANKTKPGDSSAPDFLNDSSGGSADSLFSNAVSNDSLFNCFKLEFDMFDSSDEDEPISSEDREEMEAIFAVFPRIEGFTDEDVALMVKQFNDDVGGDKSG